MTAHPALINLTSSHWIWALLVLIAALVAIGLYYRRTLPPLRMTPKATLAALRVIAALALFLALADALWSAVSTDERFGEIVILRDRSASMRLTDEGTTPRFLRADSYINERVIPRVDERVRVIEFGFDRVAFPADDRPGDSLGAATAIGDVLASLDGLIGSVGRPRAVLVLSDGANNRGQDPVAAASKLGVPVTTIGFGLPGRVRARIEKVSAPEVAFTDRPFSADAELQSGSDSGRVLVRLSSHGRTLEQRNATLASSGARTPVSFELTLTEPGTHDLRFDVIGEDGMLLPTAGRTAMVQVLKGRLRVLLLAFSLDWEFAALKRILSSHPRVELTSHVAGHPDWDGHLPVGAQWDSLDAVIFVHPSPAELESYWTPHVSAMSASGHGAVFLLDERFDAPSRQTCPIPLETARLGTRHVWGEFRSEPLPTHLNHPLVRLDPNGDWETTHRLWSARPPWAGIVVFDSLPTGANVLVRTPETGGLPVVWTRPLGQGRSVVLNGAPTWRWAAERTASGLVPEEFQAFWLNTLNWITARDAADRLSVRTSREIVHSGEEIELEASVFDEAYRFLDRAQVTARIWADSAAHDTIDAVLNPGIGDRYVGTVSALAAGLYHYDGSAVVDGDTLKLSGGVVSVESYGLEEQYSALDQPILTAIAQASDGRAYSEAEHPVFLDSLDWTPEMSTRRVEFTLGQHWSLLAIFAAALSVEWFVRRRRQLL